PRHADAPLPRQRPALLCGGGRREPATRAGPVRWPPLADDAGEVRGSGFGVRGGEFGVLRTPNPEPRTLRRPLQSARLPLLRIIAPARRPARHGGRRG